MIRSYDLRSYLPLTILRRILILTTLTFRRNSLKTQTKPLSIIFELATILVLSFTSNKFSETHLDLKYAPLDIARTVVHWGIITDLQNKRHGIASTLIWVEVRGGGKKPYPKKEMGCTLGPHSGPTEAWYFGLSLKTRPSKSMGRRRG